MPSERRYVDPASGEVVENPTIRPFTEVLRELGEGTPRPTTTTTRVVVGPRIQPNQI